MSALDVIQHFAGSLGPMPELKFTHKTLHNVNKPFAHVIEATTPDGGYAGQLMWNVHNRDLPGEIASINVPKHMQGRGIASAMVEHGRELYRNGLVDSHPIHSTSLTEDGSYFAEDEGGPSYNWGNDGDPHAFHEDTAPPKSKQEDFVKQAFIQHFAGKPYRGKPSPSSQVTPTDLKMRYSMDGGEHVVKAVHPDLGPVGWLRWKSKYLDDSPGEITWVGVSEGHRGQGVAKMMMDHARQLHQTGVTDSHPIHSTQRSEAGEGFAGAVGGPNYDEVHSHLDDEEYDPWAGDGQADVNREYHDDNAPRRLNRGDFVKTTSIHEERHARAWGSNDRDTLFPDGAVKTSAPWPAMGRRKDVKDYDHDAVREMLKNPPELTPVDPRTLHATQPSITRHGVGHYLSGAEGTFADHGNPGNEHPVVYHREDGQSLLLSGHHRAAAALLRGEPLMARQIHGPWGGPR
jgi:ribosomal protein S18 acetylase RimI-like enzyme